MEHFRDACKLVLYAKGIIFAANDLENKSSKIVQIFRF